MFSNRRGKRSGNSSGIAIGCSLLPLLFASVSLEENRYQIQSYALFWSSIACSSLYLVISSLESFSTVKTKIWKVGFVVIASSLLKQTLQSKEFSFECLFYRT